MAPLIAETKRLKSQCTLRHASGAIAGDMKPTVALRMRDSSMRRAIDAVQSDEAAGVISAGNTGALLALSKIVLKTMQGIDRPAMAATAPSAKGDVVMLDLGLNVVCDSRNLVEFALMGETFARIVLGLPAPDHRPAQHRLRGRQGRRNPPRRRRHAARKPDRRAVPRLHRRP